MSYRPKQAKRYFDNSTKREDARNAIDATDNITADESQAIHDVLDSEESRLLIELAVLAVSDCPIVQELQRKMENIILDMRTELQTA
ncbi:hypothetical protein MMG00_12045 [Ignatzschineria rhizosphaerae]|uniref:Uncharacterized protein n=1 Tax=Ignatzschineria rhizosphaerae TaxID=2923279 RepID=A0ABY3X2C2_9GAMM|nr:hypothetical protein [Ignatzschineria rhizosphaerae]UNM95916.1 hypothetical protein MMG00_12045 [Ignatzschineria rhizosphaerae]